LQRLMKLQMVGSPLSTQY